MIDRERTLFTVLLALLIYPSDNLGGAIQPEFKEPLANLTIALGRDAVFTCHVQHLGGYKVGWVKVDTKAIQAIHDHVITHNPRVSVSHHDHSTWNLRISGAQKEDEGLYMCQINTDPMKSQTAMLEIQVPPDFVPDETSGDLSVTEGTNVKLQCRATGIPSPQISWRREDQKEIIIREPAPDKSTSSNGKYKVNRVPDWTGEELYLTKIHRDQMGVYLCIASNGVPPAISKRIIVDVNFAPVIQVRNQLVGAPLGTDVKLECFVESSPRAINYWVNNNGSMIMDKRYDVRVVTNSTVRGHHNALHPNINYKVKMVLIIRNLTKQDVGTYKCVAKNSNGGAESSIRLYDITDAVKQKTHFNHYPDIDNEADRGNHPDDGNSVIDQSRYSPEHQLTENNRTHYSPFDNSIQGHVQLSTSTTPHVKQRGRRPPTQHQQASHASTRNPGADILFVTGLLVLILSCR